MAALTLLDEPVQDLHPEALVPGGGRVVLVAPHPDDEVLALGGTLAQLAAAGREVVLYAVTDGDASHPGSATWTPALLRALRPVETAQALRRLGVSARVERLRFPDGAIVRHEEALARALDLHDADTVFVPWRHDGHADHEACARAALAAARRQGARCIEFPVWALVPGHPAHAGLPRCRMRRIRVGPRFLRAKAWAIESFRSQLMPDGDAAPVLTPQALEVWRGAGEWVMA